MDYSTWNSWLTEPTVIKQMTGPRTRVLYVDNCSSHFEDMSTLEKL